MRKRFSFSPFQGIISIYRTFSFSDMILRIFLLLVSLLLLSCSPDQETILQDKKKSPVHTILALGDSLTIGLWLPIEDSYPSQLEVKLREKWYDYKIINAGISWDTTAGLLSRLDWVLEGFGSPDKGGTGGLAFIILCIGANDAFQWKDPTEIESNIRAIIEKLQAKNIPILFAGMKAPLNLWGEYGKRYEAIFPKLAKEYDLHYMDFFLEWVALKAQYNQDDRIHPTKEGYTIVVENLMEILEGEKLVRK
jgi:acyl-CoA thioesterase-1